jgi:hypothetical protein
MIKSLAENLKIGDTIVNCFMEKLVISNLIKVDSDNISDLIIYSVDTQLNTHKYSYQDVYLVDLYGESDEEKSWINWAKDNKDFLTTFDHITVVKTIYIQGFANGYEYKKQYTLEEMMQK